MKNLFKTIFVSTNVLIVLAVLTPNIFAKKVEIKINGYNQLVKQLDSVAKGGYKGDDVTLKIESLVSTASPSQPKLLKVAILDAKSLTIEGKATGPGSSPDITGIDFFFDNINIPITFKNVSFGSVNNNTAISCIRCSNLTVDGCEFVTDNVTYHSAPPHYSRAILYSNPKPNSTLQLLNSCFSYFVPRTEQRGVVYIHIGNADNTHRIIVKGCIFEGSSLGWDEWFKRQPNNKISDLYIDYRAILPPLVPHINIGDYNNANGTIQSCFFRGENVRSAIALHFSSIFSSSIAMANFGSITLNDCQIIGFNSYNGAIFLDQKGIDVLYSPVIKGNCFDVCHIHNSGHCSMFEWLNEGVASTISHISRQKFLSDNPQHKATQTPFIYNSDIHIPQSFQKNDIGKL